jgi:hypothetical protein
MRSTETPRLMKITLAENLSTFGLNDLLNRVLWNDVWVFQIGYMIGYKAMMSGYPR